MTRNLIYPSRFEPINAPANPVAPTQWFAPLPEPRKIVTAAAVLIASGCTLPPQAPVVAATVPQGWYAPLSLPVAVTKRFQTTYDLPAQPPVAAAAQVYLFPALNQPVFFPKTFTNQLYPFHFAPPAAPPTAPAMAFFQPLNQPVFAQVKYPTTKFQFPSWAFGSIATPPIWTPVVPGASPWTPTTASTDIWTPVVPGTTSWTAQ